MKNPDERNRVIISVRDVVDATNFLCNILDYPERYMVDTWTNDKICILYFYYDCNGQNVVKLHYKLSKLLPEHLIEDL